MRTKIVASFKNEGLSMTSEINLPEKDFLDVVLNLVPGKIFPIQES